MADPEVRVTIDTSEIAKSARKYVKENQEAFRKAMTPRLSRIGAHVLGRLKEASPADRGNLRNSHKVAVDEQRLIVSWFVVAKHGIYQHEGTRHSKMPPVSALIDWVKSKLRASPEEAPRVAFLVARSIMRRGGLKPQKWFDATFKAERTFVLNELRKGLADYASLASGEQT